MQNKKAYELVTTGRPDDPAFPHAMVLTVSFVISPVIGLVCHRRFACTKLDASVEASGPHDFAVRVQHRSSAVPNSVHRIPSRVRDGRERPLVGRDGAIRKVFRLKREARYFCERGWTGDLRNRRGKSARTPQNITTDRQGVNRRRQEYLYTLRVIGRAGYTTCSCHERMLP